MAQNGASQCDLLPSFITQQWCHPHDFYITLLLYIDVTCNWLANFSLQVQAAGTYMYHKIPQECVQCSMCTCDTHRRAHVHCTHNAIIANII